MKNSCVTTARTISRKLKEAALAWQLEQHWRKLRILTAYLNTIYFGNGAYGIQRAAQTYFDTSASRLTLAQAALLAGVPADPSRYDPVTNPKAARARRLEVLKAMLAQGDITRLDVRRAAREPLPRAENVHLPGIEGPAPYFVNYVKQQLIEKYGTRRVFGGGLNVQTTIDLRLQKLARKAIQSVLKEPNGPSAALVAVRPSTGEILAMYGGDNFRQSQFNLAVQGERQPGSSFKPFVLATALKEGISPATTFPSKPVNIFIGDKYWPVHNYENDYIGSADRLGQQHLRAADTARRTRERREDRTPAWHHATSEPVFRDRPGRGRRQPTRDGARLLDVRKQRPSRGRERLRQPAARDRPGQQRAQPADRQQPSRRSCRPDP